MKIINYFKRSGVDAILLLVSIAVAIKTWPDNHLAAAISYLFTLYILFSIFRMGQAADIMNDQITNPIVRARLGLGVRPGSIAVDKRTLFEKVVNIIVIIGTIGMLVYFTLNK